MAVDWQELKSLDVHVISIAFKVGRMQVVKGCHFKQRLLVIGIALYSVNWHVLSSVCDNIYVTNNSQTSLVFLPSKPSLGHW